MKTLLKAITGFALIIALVYAVAQEKIIMALMERVVTANFTSNLLHQIPDGLHVVLCGAGSPMPDPKRSGPCTAIIAGQQVYLIDSGTGSSLNMNLARIPQGAIDAILLTHFHSDHIDGLGEILLQRWVAAGGEARRDPTPVYGPDGVEQVVDGFNLAYSQDHVYRVAHHGAETIVPEGAGGKAMPFELPETGVLKTIIEKDGLKVSTFAVDHEPVEPAVGYRFDYKGRSIVVSGDTKKSENLQKFSQNVDLLVHEALNTEMVAVIGKAAGAAGQPRLVKIADDIWDYHTTPIEAAEIARDANVGHLLFNHIVPPLPISPMEKVFTKGVDDIFDRGVTVGRDGTMISLEADKKTIEVKMASPLF